MALGKLPCWKLSLSPPPLVRRSQLASVNGVAQIILLLQEPPKKYMMVFSLIYSTICRGTVSHSFPLPEALTIHDPCVSFMMLANQPFCRLIPLLAIRPFLATRLLPLNGKMLREL